MALTLTRGTINQFDTNASGGTTPVNLHIRDVEDFIPIIGRTDEPMLALMPNGGSRNKVELEWGQGDLSPRADQLNEALDASETAVDVDNGTYFQVGDLILVDDEVMLVTAIATNTLTVTRGWASSTGATHADDSPVLIIGPVTAEGNDSAASPVTQGETFINYCEIKEYLWTFTHRARVTPTYEFKQDDRFKAELKRKMMEARLDLGLTALYGLKNLGDTTATNPSTTGGLIEFTAANVTTVSGPLTQKDLVDGWQQQYTAVGQDAMGKTVMGGIFAKRVFNSFFQEDRRYEKSDAKAKLTWTEVETDFGVMKFFLNYNMNVFAKDKIITWNPEDCKRVHYEGGDWATGTYATQGWYDKGFLRGDFGFVWQGDDRRGLVDAFSVTDSDYPNLQ